MAARNEQPKRPVKATDAQVLQRVEVVTAMLLDGCSRGEIQVYALKTWGIDPKTVDGTYFPKAKEEIKRRISERTERADEQDSQQKDELIETHYRLLAKEIQSKNYAAANRTLDMLNRILGTYAPTKSELTGKDGAAIQVTDPRMPDFTGWTTEELLAWRKAQSGE